MQEQIQYMKLRTNLPLIIILIFGLLHIIPENGTSQTIFEINDFKAHKSDIKLLGATELNGNIVRLTPNEPHKVGACWYETQKIDLQRGFYLDYEFRLSDKDATYGGGNGFAFVVQNQSIDQLGGTGKNLGYKEIPYAVAVEIDTYKEGGSRDNVRLSIYDPATGNYIPYATVHEIPEVNDGKSHYARIEYSDGKMVFYLDSYIFPILTVELNLDSLVRTTDGYAWVGFTSSTSSATANHDLLSWSLSQYQAPPELDISNIDLEQEKTIFVQSRNLHIEVWDDDIIDGDTISLKVGDDWLLTNYGVVRKPIKLNYTLRGFETELILYAHNYGMVPPNTAAILIDDGIKPHKLKLTSHLTTAESVKIRYQAKGLRKQKDGGQ